MSWYYPYPNVLVAPYTWAPVHPMYMGGWMPPMVNWVPLPPHPYHFNPFWPYPVPGLPSDHPVWKWLATIDGGIYEDATVIPEGIGTTFKTKIVGYQRVVIMEGDEEGNNPSTFGLYPPAGLRAPTIVTLPSTTSSVKQPTPSPTHSSLHHSPEESPEVGRGYKEEEKMDFQDFSDPPSPIRGNFIQVSPAVTSPSLSSVHQGQSLSPIHETITESDEEDLEEL